MKSRSKRHITPLTHSHHQKIYKGNRKQLINKGPRVLRPDWLGDIDLLSVKNLNTESPGNGSNIFPKIGNSQKRIQNLSNIWEEPFGKND